MRNGVTPGAEAERKEETAGAATACGVCALEALAVRVRRGVPGSNRRLYAVSAVRLPGRGRGGCPSIYRRDRRWCHQRPGDVVRGLQGHPPQWRRGRLRAIEDRGGDDQGVHCGAWRAGCCIGRDPRAGREAHDQRRHGAVASSAGRRHLSYRRRAGPGRTFADARRRARCRALLRAVSRTARAGAGRHAAGHACRCRTAAGDDRGGASCSAGHAAHRGAGAGGV